MAAPMQSQNRLASHRCYLKMVNERLTGAEFITSGVAADACEDSKQFFFENRSKKLLFMGLRFSAGAHPNIQKFFASFFKKEGLSSSPEQVSDIGDWY